MSWIFHEPFEPAIHVRRAVAPPSVARRSFARPARPESVTDEPWTPQRRTYAPPPASVGPAAVLAQSATGRIMAGLLAAGVYDDTPEPTTPARRYQAGYATSADTGLSASFSVTITGRGDDPYGAVGLAGGSGFALGADTLRALAVQNPAVFAGATASRTA
jgi:hypothetical protein